MVNSVSFEVEGLEELERQLLSLERSVGRKILKLSGGSKVSLFHKITHTESWL